MQREGLTGMLLDKDVQACTGSVSAGVVAVVRGQMVGVAVREGRREA